MDVKALNGTSLAFMGDAVMSLLVREKLLKAGFQKSHVMQQKSTYWVSANAQARLLETLKNQNFFNEEEWGIVLRGRNTHPKTVAKNADVLTYRKATGLEAIFGWLYLNGNNDRLMELWHEIEKIGDAA